jgi:arylsulfatase A-like enzyme/Tfp pilus assembly protein PilF
MTATRVLAGGLLALLIATAGCSGGGAAPESLVVITIDTLRADRLGCYGNTNGLTPNLDALATEGVVFEDATAPTPITLPSHATMFTGRYPTATGVRNNGTFVLPDGEVTLAEILRDEGWQTGAVIAAFPLKRRFGLGQGFRIYDDDVEPPGGSDAQQLRVHFLERDARAVTDRAIQVWQGLGAGKRFLWVHYFDPHAPYAPPAAFARHPDPYDGETAYTDDEIGRLLDAIRRDDPRAAVAVVSDHGEGLGEHGEFNHGLFLYQTTLHVPFILRAPGRVPAGTRVDEPVSLADLMPTLLGVLDVEGGGELDGGDLRPLIDGGDAPDRAVYAETWMPRLEYRFSELTAIRDGKLKYIDAPRPELFDLAQDPGETNDLQGRHPDEELLAGELAAFRADAESTSSAGASSDLDPETEEKLRSLGYLAGGAPDVPQGERGRDPKDMTDYFARHGEANMALSAGRFDEGLGLLRELVDEAPENFMIHHQIASGLLAADRNAEAEKELELLVAAAPTFSTGYRLLAEAQARQGKIDAAIRSYRAAAEVAPDMARPWFALGAKLEDWGRFESAAEAYRAAIDREPTEPKHARRLVELRSTRGSLDEAIRELAELAERHPDAAALWTVLGNAEHRRGDPAAALAHLGRALEIEPQRYDTLIEVGEIQLGSGQAPVAEKAFRRAQAGSPDRHEAAFGLARALLVQDRGQEALDALDACLAANPSFSPAHSVRGIHHERRGDLDAARASFQQALRINPGDRQARDGLRRLGSSP